MRVKIVEPGFVKTDFAGRSLELKVYFSAQAQLGAGGDEPEVVAEVIYRAANRAAADDTTFIGGVKQQFGICPPHTARDERRRCGLCGGGRVRHRSVEHMRPFGS